ncbi:hypothetical protein VPH35_026654 [Triticum aestivum]
MTSSLCFELLSTLALPSFSYADRSNFSSGARCGLHLALAAPVPTAPDLSLGMAGRISSRTALCVHCVNTDRSDLIISCLCPLDGQLVSSASDTMISLRL